MTEPAPEEIVLDVEDVEVSFGKRRGFSDLLRKRSATRVKAVNGVSFRIRRHETLDLVGKSRTDVYRGPNTVNLLGNYPASIARAGFGYLTKAEELRRADGSIAAADTSLYDRYTDQAVFCYELALLFDPYNGLVAAGFYPSLLLERAKVDSALSYLEQIHGRIPPDLERSAVLGAMPMAVQTANPMMGRLVKASTLVTSPISPLAIHSQTRFTPSPEDPWFPIWVAS